MSIEEILMRRDGNTQAEARERVDECRRLCEQCLSSGNLDGVEDIVAMELGLEPDYIEELLGFM